MTSARHTIIACSTIIFGFAAGAQTDTLRLHDREILCKVREVSALTVSYTHPGEEALYSINKAMIQQIAFSNGRVEYFDAVNSLQIIHDATYYPRVAVAGAPAEVQGLYRLGVVTAKAKGFTDLAPLVKIQERALRKLQMRAALLGGSIVLPIEQNSIPHQSPALPLLFPLSSYSLQSGVVYTHALPDATAFLEAIEGMSTFAVTGAAVFGNNMRDMVAYPIQSGRLEILRQSLTVKDGVLYLQGRFTSSLAPASKSGLPVNKLYRFRLTNFDDTGFTLYLGDARNQYYNFRLLFQKR